MILQPPPAQTMVQALELLYALGGENQTFQNDIKENQPKIIAYIGRNL